MIRHCQNLRLRLAPRILLPTCPVDAGSTHATPRSPRGAYGPPRVPRLAPRGHVLLRAESVRRSPTWPCRWRPAHAGGSESGRARLAPPHGTVPRPRGLRTSVAATVRWSCALPATLYRARSYGIPSRDSSGTDTGTCHIHRHATSYHPTARPRNIHEFFPFPIHGTRVHTKTR